MKHIKNISFKIKLLCFLVVIFVPTFSLALSSDSSQPMQLKAESAICEGHKNENICTYTGNVNFVQGSTNLQAKKLVVNKSNGKINKIVASGGHSHYSTIMDDNHKKIDADADEITINPDKNIMTLVGNGQVVDGQDKFIGPYIEYRFNK